MSESSATSEKEPWEPRTGLIVALFVFMPSQDCLAATLLAVAVTLEDEVWTTRRLLLVASASAREGEDVCLDPTTDLGRNRRECASRTAESGLKMTVTATTSFPRKLCRPTGYADLARPARSTRCRRSIHARPSVEGHVAISTTYRSSSRMQTPTMDLIRRTNKQ